MTKTAKKEHQEIDENKTETHQTINVDELTKQLDSKQQELDELTDTLKRLQAEFENYKKRVDKENCCLIKNSNAVLIKKILPVLDSFELAIKNNGQYDGNSNPEIEKYRKGMEILFAQLFSILKDEGLRVIETKNQKFDPYKHEVLMMKECDKDDDLILEELQKGYMLNEYVLRHSKIMIAKCQKLQ